MGMLIKRSRRTAIFAAWHGDLNSDRFPFQGARTWSPQLCKKAEGNRTNESKPTQATWQARFASAQDIKPAVSQQASERTRHHCVLNNIQSAVSLLGFLAAGRQFVSGRNPASLEIDD